MTCHAAVVHSPLYACDIGLHVFPVTKYARVREALAGAGDIHDSEVLEPPHLTRDDLLLVHTEEYLDDLDQLRWTPRTMWSELPLHADVVRAYKVAAGGTVFASREARKRGLGVHIGGGFHHAFSDRAEGFCYINDLACAIRVLQRDGHVSRAAVVDLDVHQGNGTAGIFRGDDRVFTLSIHQEANYPVPKQRSTLDIGLENGTGDAEYLRRLEEALARVWEFQPEIVLYQAGADPFHDDLLGGLALSLAGLGQRDRLVLEGCAERSIPAVVTLGGGYARRVEDTIEAHLQTCRLALRLAREMAERRV
ncbi:MAG: histone deacetylase [Candidatus Eisenbacteria bacterium]|uniref:Histone deacetylase n=1 Tax=Eiseniibacteriota bacterium TaxID=2212470 RepID=A0A538SJC8_UNCEI|nr:MAG: histone deacetylase [Candidatus Eisenbacteria bacterium]